MSPCASGHDHPGASGLDAVGLALSTSCGPETGVTDLDGAIVDREALLADLGHVLTDLRYRWAARRDVERAFVAAYTACEVA